ncbi:MAG: hypothetical protein KC619_01875 [Myxococcales bacterium]|nr:hypothetical protein [Myxococcales bacterium]
MKDTLRRFLVALLLAAAIPFAAPFMTSPASADIAPPQVTMNIVGRAERVASGEPDHATFELRNTSGEAIEVFLFRAILREGTNHPLPITRAEIDGREVGRTLTVPARETRVVTVYFELPDTLHGRGRYDIDLRITASGHGAVDSQPASLTRGPSGARKLTTGTPKR